MKPTTAADPIPAAIDAATYVYPERGPEFLARIDARLTACGYVYKYAPVSNTPAGVDFSGAFEDVWGEVIEWVPFSR
jgi:hypothetical protein